MKFCQIIATSKVLSKAMSLVASAQKEVVVTMDVDEELKYPLPKEYHALIEQQANKRRVVRRYGFGSKSAFNKMEREHTGVLSFYVGRRRQYQRMLVIDRKKGLFVVGGQVFFTDFAPLAASLVNYVEVVYNSEGV